MTEMIYNVILKKEIEIGIVVVEISVVTNLKKNLEDNSNTPWLVLENKLQFVLTSFLSQLDVGLKTKRTSRLDPEVGGDSMQYSLGIKFDVLNKFVLGMLVLCYK
jgi:hypothetical protein